MGLKVTNKRATTPAALSSTDLTALSLPTVPSAVSSYVTAKHIVGPVCKTVLTITALPVTISDTNQYGSVEILDFAEGVIGVHNGTFNLTTTTHSAIASTLNSGVTVQIALGTAAASAATLATTMIDINPGTGQTVPTFSSSTTIDVAPSAAKAYLKATALFDGSSSAKKVYLNFAVATATDIDADASVLVTGTITIVHSFGGDY